MNPKRNTTQTRAQSFSKPRAKTAVDPRVRPSPATLSHKPTNHTDVTTPSAVKAAADPRVAVFNVKGGRGGGQPKRLGMHSRANRTPLIVPTAAHGANGSVASTPHLHTAPTPRLTNPSPDAPPDSTAMPCCLLCWPGP